MTESLEINQSTDLLNEFLGQQDGSQETPIPTPIINDSEDEDGVDKITPKNTPPVIDNSGLDITNELPDGFETESEEQEESTEGSEDSPEADKTESQYSFKALAGYLSEEGIIDFEDSESLEDTPEVLFESVKNTIAREIQSYKDSIPDKAKSLIDYLEKGGDVDSYLEAITKPFDISKVDLTSESDQERVVREYLKLQEYSQEEVDETIKDYKDSLILDKQAKVATKQVQKYFEKREQSVLVEQEAIQEAQKEQYKQYLSTVNTTIDTSETLAGLPLTAKEKAEFKKYLLIPDKQGVTQYAREVAENPVQTQLELAYLKFMKYDFSNAMKKGETNATKKFKSIFKGNETSIKSGRTTEETISTKTDLSAFDMFKARQNN